MSKENLFSNIARILTSHFCTISSQWCINLRAFQALLSRDGASGWWARPQECPTCLPAFSPCLLGLPWVSRGISTPPFSQCPSLLCFLLSLVFTSWPQPYMIWLTFYKQKYPREHHLQGSYTESLWRQLSHLDPLPVASHIHVDWPWWLLCLLLLHNWVWFLAPTWWLSAICDWSSGGPDTRFWPPWAYTHACTYVGKTCILTT